MQDNDYQISQVTFEATSAIANLLRLAFRRIH